MGHHIARSWVDDLELGTACPGIGEVGVADHQVACLIAGENHVDAAFKGLACQAVAVHHEDGACTFVVDIELAVHAEALAGICHVKEAEVVDFPDFLDTVGDGCGLLRVNGIVVHTQIGGLALVAVAIDDAHGIPVTLLIGIGQRIGRFVGYA